MSALGVFDIVGSKNRWKELLAAVHRLSARESPKESKLVTPKMSLAAQNALEDMIDGKMYLLAKPQREPWSLLPRTSANPLETRKAHSASVEWSAANELLDRGFIEASSSLTFVVSQPGHQFYKSQQKGNSSS
jgi:hypothetical protein